MDRQTAENRAFLNVVRFHPTRDLKCLAAKPDHQHTTDIWIGGISPLRPLKHIIGLALCVDATTCSVNQRDYAVDVGIVAQDTGIFDFLGNEFCHTGRTVHRGKRRNIVARPHLAIRTQKPLECRAVSLRHHHRWLCCGTECMVTLEGSHINIVFMHPVASGNGGAGKTNNLAVFYNRLIQANIMRRNFVPARDACCNRYVAYTLTDVKRFYRKQNVVDV